jgi:hypothetical protein
VTLTGDFSLGLKANWAWRKLLTSIYCWGEERVALYLFSSILSHGVHTHVFKIILPVVRLNQTTRQPENQTTSVRIT